jgi:DNA-binding GntR family transcriptional regulator
MATIVSEDNSQDRAYRHLKEAILNLEFKTGRPLRAQAIAESLSLSRTPVREALGRLEQEGLVARDGGWGYVVRPIDLKEAMDLYKVREALEVEAMKEAIPNLTEIYVSRMCACLHRAKEEIRRRRFGKFRENAREFYRTVAEATGNTCLQNMLMVIDDRVRLLGALMADKHLGRPTESLAENEAVLAAMRAGDVVAAEHAVRKHVSNARETLLRYVLNEPGRVLIGRVRPSKRLTGSGSRTSRG